MSEKRKPKGAPLTLPEWESEEAATPTESDLSLADALAQLDPLLAAMWNAGEYEGKDEK